MKNLFNESLTTRFNTLERNIKSKSNSFYDSYLDLLEATIKYFLDENNVSYDDSRTCGFLVKESSVKDFLVNTLKLDDYTYNKLPDYIKKCNDHKHKKEKNLGIDSVINYLKVYYDLINYYIDFIKGVRVEYHAEYFSSIFGETERLNNEYREEVLRLKDELKESYENNKLSKQDLEQYQSLLSIKDLELLNLDEQNQKLQTQISILKDIKLNSMEEKLNKTIDMLNNMQDYLIENRIIARRTSKLIDGRDITDEELAAERIKMEGIKTESKPQNVFEKLNHQDEQIDDISQKLEGISIENLYTLAKRTWDSEDYQTAQKYYNHISLLNPLDWEAPLYASLCNYKGRHDIYFWEDSFNQVSKIFASTINYINNLDIPNDKKEKEMSRCIEIMKDYMLKVKRGFFKNIGIFNKYSPDYVCKVESFFLTVYSHTKEINLNSLIPFRVFLAEECLDLIKRTGKTSSDITKDIYMDFVQIKDKDFNTNSYVFAAQKK